MDDYRISTTELLSELQRIQAEKQAAHEQRLLIGAGIILVVAAMGLVWLCWRKRQQLRGYVVKGVAPFLLVLLLLSTAYPPWVVVYRNSSKDYIRRLYGHGFLLSPPSAWSDASVQIDFERLSLEWLFLAGLAGAAFLHRQRSAPASSHSGTTLPGEGRTAS